MSKSNIPELTRSFLFSAIDHAYKDAKTPLPVVRSRFEEWKQARMDAQSREEKANEDYILQYSNKRTNYETAYSEWIAQRTALIEEIKEADNGGIRQNLMAQLSAISFPEALSLRVPDIYTKYKANQ